MATITVNNEKVIGTISKTATSEYRVSLVNANIGEFVSVMQWYEKNGEMCKGKGNWYPKELVKDLADAMLLAVKEDK